MKHTEHGMVVVSDKEIAAAEGERAAEQMTQAKFPTRATILESVMDRMDRCVRYLWRRVTIKPLALHWASRGRSPRWRKYRQAAARKRGCG